MQAVSYYGIGHTAAGSLKSLFNITQLLSSFVVFTVFMKYGYRKPTALIFGLMAAFCLFVPLVNTIGMVAAYLLFAGIAYTTIKVSCYSMVSLFAKNPGEHASFVNLMEGIHMLGNMAALWIYSLFTTGNGGNWIYLFWVITAICALLSFAYVLVRIPRAVSAKKPATEFAGFGKALLSWVIVLFFIMMCAYDFLEQGTSSWLSTFNNEILLLPKAISVQLQSVFVLAMCAGRLLNSWVLRKVHWKKVFAVNFILAIIMLLFTFANLQKGLGANATSIFNVPLLAFGIPLLGLFIAPVYPTLVSTMLSTFTVAQQPMLMSVLMISGAIIDSFAVQLTGVLFDKIGGINAFKVNMLGSLLFLLLLSFVYARLVDKRALKHTGN